MSTPAFLLKLSYFGSQLLFLTLKSLSPGRKKTVLPDVTEMLKKQAECLQMPSPIMIDPNYGENFNQKKKKEGKNKQNNVNILYLHYVIQNCLFCVCTQKFVQTTSHPQRGSAPSTPY